MKHQLHRSALVEEALGNEATLGGQNPQSTARPPQINRRLPRRRMTDPRDSLQKSDRRGEEVFLGWPLCLIPSGTARKQRKQGLDRLTQARNRRRKCI